MQSNGRPGARARRPGGSLPRGQIAQVQRARVLSAATALIAERGLAGTSVSAIVKRAGVSRRTFYELFDSAEECFLAAAEDALEVARLRVLEVYDPAASFRVRIRAGLVALLRFLDEEPLKGRLLVVESLGAGPEALRRREEWLAPLYAAVDAGRAGTPVARSSSPSPPRSRRHARGAELSTLTATGAVGGALAIVHARILQADGAAPEPPLAELANPLMSMIVLPYLGPAAARRELAEPAPAPLPVRTQPTPIADHLAALPMRLTYRTILVIRAIAAEPSASNRRIGHVAEVEDQGQISKLLRRLERLGLIENGCVVTAHGMANAWTLTPAGRELERATRGSPGATR